MKALERNEIERAPYIAAAIPADEPARLAELRALDILDTDAEEAFDKLTWLAAHIAGTYRAGIVDRCRASVVQVTGGIGRNGNAA